MPLKPKAEAFPRLPHLPYVSFRYGRFGAMLLALLLSIGGTVRAAEVIRVAGTTSAIGTLQLLADKFTHDNPKLKIVLEPNLASEGGIKALADGAIQLAVASRPLDGSEARRGMLQVEYARTPFVFAVSARSTVSAVTSLELADIYAGKMVTWPDGTPIRVVLRPANNRNNALAKGLSRGIAEGVLAAESRPGMQIVITDRDAADKVERIPGAISAIALAVIVSERRPLKALALDGVEPTPANAAKKSYPLYKSLYFVTGAKRSAAVKRFIAFVQSPAGHQILADNGHWIP